MTEIYFHCPQVFNWQKLCYHGINVDKKIIIFIQNFKMTDIFFH